MSEKLTHCKGRDLGRIVATVECRMSSSRLPGKILMPACGKPLLEILAQRLLLVPELDAVVLATTGNPGDDPVAGLAERLGIGCWRGSEDDVLRRVLDAAHWAGADTIVEITGDCPLIDPAIISQVIGLYRHNDCDYASNIDPRAFPDGMDTQVFSTALLAEADTATDDLEDREHVSWFIRRHPGRFRKVHLPAPPELRWPELGLTLDEQADYDLIRTLFEHFLPDNPGFGCQDMVRHLRANPGLLELNAAVKRRSPSA
ncbi:MAG: spore coat polysaccharide biosynthesis protein [Desulfovibrionaceae bacterium]|nr:MAG: spore coat polysaccharide biosynthesis protein [Desulfovibrionaceae bacterium]